MLFICLFLCVSLLKEIPGFDPWLHCLRSSESDIILNMGSLIGIFLGICVGNHMGALIGALDGFVDVI